jgi:hypothetical protein
MAEKSIYNKGLYVASSNDNPTPHSLKSGGGDGTFDDMEPRVAALEKGFERIERKIDGLVTDVAEMKGQLKAMPTAISFGELKGRVDSLPTTAKISALFGIAVAVITIVTKWQDVTALFHH